MQAETLVRVLPDGSEELWFSKEYISKEIESTYMSGMISGCKIEFHTINPISEEELLKAKEILQKLLVEQFEKDIQLRRFIK